MLCSPLHDLAGMFLLLWQADRVSTTPGVGTITCRLANVSDSLWHVGVQAGRSRVYIQALRVIFMTDAEHNQSGCWTAREKHLLKNLVFIHIYTLGGQNNRNI